MRPEQAGEEELVIDVGTLPETGPDESLTVRPALGRGSFVPGVMAIATGEALFFGGGALFFTDRAKGGCDTKWSSSSSGCTFAKVGLIAGPSLAALGGAWLLFYYRSDTVELSVQRAF